MVRMILWLSFAIGNVFDSQNGAADEASALTSTYEEAEKAAAEPTVARMVATENFIVVGGQTSARKYNERSRECLF